MTLRGLRLSVSTMAIVLGFGLLAGCGSGDTKLENKNPGINDLNVIAAFGDSITQGSECRCVPYPPRLSGLVGKIVYNTGIGGSKAGDNVGRTQTVINKYHPAFMFILYGVNDIIHGHSISGILGALDKMVSICKQNNVVPVLMTYPIPIAGHRMFASNTSRLNEGIIAIAEAQEIEYVDLEKEFGGSEEDPNNPGWITPNPALYEPDGLHPNDAGTQIMAMSCADLF